MLQNQWRKWWPQHIVIMTTLNLFIFEKKKLIHFVLIQKKSNSTNLCGSWNRSLSNVYHSVWIRAWADIHLIICLFILHHWLSIEMDASGSKKRRLSQSHYAFRKLIPVNYCETMAKPKFEPKKHNFQRDPVNNTILIRRDYVKNTKTTTCWSQCHSIEDFTTF